ncbi:hypothetical protein D3C85_683940 [compost metagenome]
MIAHVKRAGEREVSRHIEERAARRSTQGGIDLARAVQHEAAAYLQGLALRTLQHAAAQEARIAGDRTGPCQGAGFFHGDRAAEGTVHLKAACAHGGTAAELILDYELATRHRRHAGVGRTVAGKPGGSCVVIEAMRACTDAAQGRGEYVVDIGMVEIQRARAGAKPDTRRVECAGPRGVPRKGGGPADVDAAS